MTSYAYNIEMQLMKDWQPRSRPSQGLLDVGSGLPTHTKLYPGAAAVEMEHMIATIEGATRIGALWAVLRVAVTIDGVPLGEPRPGIVYLGGSDVATGIVHFPVVAGNDNKMYRGFHSLLMRVV